ncbi:2-polyprenyl-6-methoxyphenol hydroxylase-like FAD-dependent oxidoreductase [Thermocatellispora tengchongensis]|uniref:2-polyprenyl-6-methoxyphenol hydroxylase-like FAD-dependent oxidoreductase n=2 Tax=Thermocatellispora tengchongensis TaxID=1073253 RepID=A0A840PI34_9ACTN|nr:2-polyprenyl-6-methoxyphenol hydroxylase-like FAD-dependent oxidoreductase [Thermocatellispora tengchongensis]
MLLARRGYRVLLVDKAVQPSDTVSTHYIQQYGLVRMKEWGLLDALTATDTPAIRRMTISYRDNRIDGFADPMDGIDATYAPRRTVLDPILLDGARAAGVEVREGCTVCELIMEDGRVAGVRTADGGEERAKIVIGADGSGSLVAREAGAEIYQSIPAASFVYYSYWTGLDTHFHSRIGVGRQVGVWPTSHGQTLIAIMKPIDRWEEFRGDVEGNFLQVVKDIVPDIAEEVASSGERVERFIGMRYPDNYYRRSYGPGWALVGDAGYHKDPITGQGISDAFVHAEILAERIAEGLSGARPMDEALAAYQAERDERTASAYRFAATIGALVLPPELEKVFTALSRNEEFARDFYNLIAGAITGEQFFAPDNMARMIGSLG